MQPDKTHRVLVRYAGGASTSLTVLADTPREAARKILLGEPKVAAVSVEVGADKFHLFLGSYITKEA